MAAKLTDPVADEDTAVGPPDEETTGTSRWQKVVGILGLVVVVWVGSELYDVVSFDGFDSGSGSDTPVVSQSPDGGGGGHRPPVGGH